MRFCLLAVFLVLLSLAGFSAEISGKVYSWDSFEPLKNSVVEINTVPRQVMIAVDGHYEFRVGDGNYAIRSAYIDGKSVKFEDSENVTVEGDGNYVHDLIMLPSSDNYDFLFQDYNTALVTTALASAGSGPAERGYLSWQDGFVAIALLLVTALALFFFGPKLLVSRATGLGVERIGLQEKLALQKELYGHEEGDNAFGGVPRGLGKDLAEVVDAVRKNGGRLMQKELREKLPHSEAKVSLIVAKLEERGIVRKFRKGRENVIVLK